MWVQERENLNVSFLLKALMDFGIQLGFINLILQYSIFDPYESHMDIYYNKWCLSGGPAILHGKNFIVGLVVQTFRAVFFIPTTLKGTIYFYHFIPLSLTFTLPRGHQFNTMQTIFLDSYAHCSG